MNAMKSEIRHIFFTRNKVDLFQVEIDNATVRLNSKSQSLFIEITGEKAEESIKALLFDIYSMLFLYLGGFPKIVKIEFNGELADISQYTGMYITQKNFTKVNLALCSINEKTINENKLHLFKQLRQIPISSLQYLVSESYKSVVTNHKITLLLHIIDGIVPDEMNKKMRDEIKTKYKPLDANGNDKYIGNYMPKCYYLCENYFFAYNRENNCEILSLLQKSEFEFLQAVADTRNWYSHFLKEEKTYTLRDGKDIIIYFEIICYIIRLYLVGKLDLKAQQVWVTEYFFCIHDWILEIVYNQDSPLKSEIYKIDKKWREIDEVLRNIPK